MVVPALLTANGREYIEVQTTEFEKEIMPEDIYIQPPMEFMVDPMLEEVEMEPIIKIPQEILTFLDVLVYLFGVIILGLLFLAVIEVIRKELKQFAKASEEEEDVVESLEPVKEDESIFLPKRTWKRTEEDRTRRLYRKFIRKHRKELPAIYETPAEIEMAAGVADTEEGKAMHEKYEQARYGM